MGARMKKVLLIPLMILVIAACAGKNHESSAPILVDKPKRLEKPAVVETTKTASVVVDVKDLQVLEKMNKAIEAYVLKKQKKEFMALCKDSRFDCFMDEKPFPKLKKKITRTLPPYASGSKMGLQGETRVHVRYDFYP